MKYWLVLASLPVWLGLSAPILYAQQNAIELLQLAGRMYKEKQFEKAIAYYEKIIKMQPPPDNNLLAKAYHNLGSTKLTYYNQFEMKRQDYSEIFSYFEKSVELAPQVADNYYSRGLIYWLLQQEDKALADLERALEIKPSFAAVHILRGKIYWQQGNREEACAEWQKAAHKGNLDAYNHIKQNCNTIETLPVKIQSGLTAEQYLDSTKIKIKTKRYKEAEELATLALQIDKRFKEAYYWRGIARLNLNNIDAACADWRKAKALGDNSVNQLLNDHCDGNYK